MRKIKAVFLARVPKDIWKVRTRQRVLRELLILKRQEESFSFGAKWFNQIHQNVHTADIEFPSDIILELTNATEKLKQKLGPNPDMYQSKSRIY